MLQNYILEHGRNLQKKKLISLVFTEIWEKPGGGDENTPRSNKLRVKGINFRGRYISSTRYTNYFRES